MKQCEEPNRNSGAKPTEAQGKTLLMEAALRLAMRTRSLQALGIREIGREAGLNPNTFYRHFKDLDDLGLTIIQNVVKDLREPLRILRRQAALATLQSAQAGQERANPVLEDMGFSLERARRVVQETVKLVLEFAAAHPEAFVMGVCELNGASPVIRETLRQVMTLFAQDMVDDIRQLNLLPIVDLENLSLVSTMVIRDMFQLSVDYIEQPQRRQELREQAEKMILMQLTGAILLSLEQNPVSTGA